MNNKQIYFKKTIVKTEQYDKRLYMKVTRYPTTVKTLIIWAWSIFTSIQLKLLALCKKLVVHLGRITYCSEKYWIFNMTFTVKDALQSKYKR